MTTDIQIDREREEWMCVECFEDPKRRHTPGFAEYGEDRELCGYHWGVRKGYYADSESGGETDR